MTGADWNEFQRLHKGKGWTKREMSQAYKDYKQAAGIHIKQITLSWSKSVGRTGSCKQRLITGDGTPVNSSSNHQKVSDTSTKQVDHQRAQDAIHLCTAPDSTSVGGAQHVQTEFSPEPHQQAPVTPGSGLTYAASSRPSVTPSPSTRLPAQAVAELRAAVTTILSGQKPPQLSRGAGTQPVPFDLSGLDSSSQCGDDCAPSQIIGGWSATTQVYTSLQQQQAQSIGVTVGCFGGSNPGKLTWNGLQKMCKGRGLTQAELSAAWKHYKSTGQLPPELQQTLSTPHPDMFLQQQSLPHVHLIKWGAFKEWVITHSRSSSRSVSRAVSRAISRAVSRVASPVASPQTSPKSKQASHQQHHGLQQHEKVQQQTPCYSKDSDVSITGSYTGICTATVATAATLELDVEEAAGSCRPSDQLPIPDVQHHCQLQQLTTLHGQSTDLVEQSQSGMHSLQSLLAHSSKSGAAVADNSAAPSGQLPNSSCLDPTRTAAGRLVRELLDHNHPDLFAGFSPWVPVSITPAILKQLKRQIPARPGIYEWGARMPLRGGAGTHASTVAEPVRKPSIMGSSGLEYGPVVCFYMGKTGGCLCLDTYAAPAVITAVKDKFLSLHPM